MPQPARIREPQAPADAENRALGRAERGLGVPPLCPWWVGVRLPLSSDPALGPARTPSPTPGGSCRQRGHHTRARCTCPRLCPRDRVGHTQSPAPAGGDLAWPGRWPPAGRSPTPFPSPGLEGKLRLEEPCRDPQCCPVSPKCPICCHRPRAGWAPHPHTPPGAFPGSFRDKDGQTPALSLVPPKLTARAQQRPQLGPSAWQCPTAPPTMSLRCPPARSHSKALSSVPDTHPWGRGRVGEPGVCV